MHLTYFWPKITFKTVQEFPTVCLDFTQTNKQLKQKEKDSFLRINLVHTSSCLAAKDMVIGMYTCTCISSYVCKPGFLNSVSLLLLPMISASLIKQHYTYSKHFCFWSMWNKLTMLLVILGISRNAEAMIALHLYVNNWELSVVRNTGPNSTTKEHLGRSGFQIAKLFIGVHDKA